MAATRFFEINETSAIQRTSGNVSMTHTQIARLSVRNKNAVSAHQKWIAVLTQVIKFEAFLGEVNTYYFRDFLNILVGVAPTKSQLAVSTRCSRTV